MTQISLLLTAFLFGGMVLYSFGFAAIAFHALPAKTAGGLLRAAFPWFYLFVIVTGAAGALATLSSSGRAAAYLAIIAVTALFARQILMPAINAATDVGNKTRFNLLHGLSVVLTLGHIVLAAWVILQLAA